MTLLMLGVEEQKASEQFLVNFGLPINPVVENKTSDHGHNPESTTMDGENDAVLEEEGFGNGDSKGVKEDGPTTAIQSKPSNYMPELTAPLNSLFEIRSTPSKGYSVFAKSQILKGTLILAEKPLLRVINSYYLAEHVEEALEKLSEMDKKKYWSLASAHGQSQSRYPDSIHPEVPIHEKQRIREQHSARTAKEPSTLSIFMTNAMGCENGGAVFETASRFNHSCIPNAYFSWSKANGVEQIYAIRDIEAGEEITLSYCDPLYEYSQRCWEFQHYDFTCLCPACSDLDDPNSFGAKSRQRRWRLAELEDGANCPGDFRDKLSDKIEMARLLNEEGLSGTCAGNNYLSLARLVANQTKPDYRFALAAANKALDVYTTCLGADSEETLKAGKVVRELRRAEEQAGK